MTIGVAAVITMVALGTGPQETVADEVRSAGTNLIRVDAGNFTRGGEESKIATGLGSASTLTPDDAAAIGAMAGVKYASGVVKLRGWVANGSTREYLQVLGTEATYPLLFAWRPARGKFFQPADVNAAAPVAIVGSGARDRLFGEGVNAVGRDIQIRDATLRIVAVASGGDDDQMDMVFVPFTFLQRMLAIPNIHGVVVAAAQAGDATRLAGEIRPLLRARHHLDADASIARLRQGGLGGNQMPRGGGGLVPDDFTVKTQAAEALTKGLYTSVAAFVLANMPKVDQINLEEMSGAPARRHDDDGAACRDCRDLAGGRRHRHHERDARIGE